MVDILGLWYIKILLRLLFFSFLVHYCAVEETIYLLIGKRLQRMGRLIQKHIINSMKEDYYHHFYMQMRWQRKKARWHL